VRLVLAVGLALAVAPAIAFADEGGGDVDLDVHDLPIATPRSLLMRRGQTAARSTPRRRATGAARGDASPEGGSLLTELPRAVADLLDVPEDELAERVSFHFNLGFGVDGGEPTGDPLASGAPLVEGDSLSRGQFYERLRLYTLGDAVLGTRGLVVPSLSTYFAAQFRLNQEGTPITSAVPSVYDAGGGSGAVIPYATYAELDDVFRTPALRPVFVRAGRQFRYGGAIAHFDGITLGYDGASISASLFGGQRVSLWGLHKSGSSAEVDDLLGGGQWRIDLERLVGSIPLVASGSALWFGEILNLENRLSVRATPWLFVTGKVRLRGGSFARESLSARAMLGENTRITATLDNRHDADWTYDLAVADVSYADDDPRRLLSLGVPLPRVRLSVRGATVLFDNLDLLARSAVAVEYADNERQPANAFARSYFELGGSAAVRFRRSLRIGGSALWRGYGRDSISIADRVAGAPDPLPTDTGALGERSFLQGDLNVRYDLGQRQFRVLADFYGRIYRDPFQPGPFIVDRSERRVDARLGSRFAVEAQVGKRLRVRGEYDTVFAPEHLAPEIRGPKSLRLVAEGSF